MFEYYVCPKIKTCPPLKQKISLNTTSLVPITTQPTPTPTQQITKQPTPTKCHTGFYNPVTQKYDKDCSPGYYKDEKQCICATCGKGNFSDGKGIECSQCEAGTYQDQEVAGNCKPCSNLKPITNYDSRSCVSTCGQYSDTADTQTYNHNNKCVFTCPKGYYGDPITKNCIECQGGYYCPGTNKKLPCPDFTTIIDGYTTFNVKKTIGNTSTDGADSKDKCNILYKKNGLNLAPDGYFDFPGSGYNVYPGYVKKCPEGAGKTRIIDGKKYNRCETCDEPGTYIDKTDNNKCVKCTPGFICDGSGKKTPCTKVGSYCPEGSDIELNCPKGFYCETSAEKKACKPGTYNSQTNQKFCQPCHNGYYCDEEEINPKPCSYGEFCPEGTTSTSIQTCSKPGYTFVNRDNLSYSTLSLEKNCEVLSAYKTLCNIIKGSPGKFDSYNFNNYKSCNLYNPLNINDQEPLSLIKPGNKIMQKIDNMAVPQSNDLFIIIVILPGIKLDSIEYINKLGEDVTNNIVHRNLFSQLQKIVDNKGNYYILKCGTDDNNFKIISCKLTIRSDTRKDPFTFRIDYINSSEEIFLADHDAVISDYDKVRDTKSGSLGGVLNYKKYNYGQEYEKIRSFTKPKNFLNLTPATLVIGQFCPDGKGVACENQDQGF